MKSRVSSVTVTTAVTKYLQRNPPMKHEKGNHDVDLCLSTYLLFVEEVYDIGK